MTDFVLNGGTDVSHSSLTDDCRWWLECLAEEGPCVEYAKELLRLDAEAGWLRKALDQCIETRPAVVRRGD